MIVHKVVDQLYDGAQLHHAFCYENGGPLGASIVYFRGPAEVKDHLVDIEDRLADDFIKSKDMWHFIIEIPGRHAHRDRTLAAQVYLYLY